MIILIKLLLAHLLGDFVFQSKKWVTSKEELTYRSPFLYLHILIHGVLMLMFLEFNPSTIMPIAVIVGCHLCIDLSKLILSKPENEHTWFFVDQLLHLISILSVWFIWFGSDQNLFTDFFLNRMMVYGLAVIFLTRPMSFAMANILSPFSAGIPSSKDQSLAHAGTYIGMIERLFVFGLIVSNHWEAMGFLIAAKSVFRFGDLQESKGRKLTEYILIGTLISFGMAILTGVIIRYVISNLE